MIVAALLGLARPAHAEGTELRSVTMTEALDYARAHQPQIRAARARIAAETANARVPAGQWLPTVGVTAQLYGGTANNTTGSYLGTGAVDVPRIGGTRSRDGGAASWQPYASTLAGAGLRQELFDFGRIAAQTAAADALVELRKHGADAERLDVELNVEEAFLAVQAAKAVLVAADGAYERARMHRDQAQAGVQSGLRPPIELTRAEADLQRFDIGRIRARGGILAAQGVLAAAMGAPEVAIDASGDAPGPDSMPALASAIRQATARDPRIQTALAGLKAQEDQTRAIGAQLRPNLAFTGTLSGRAGGAPPSSGERADQTGWLPNVPNWDIGVVLSWPIFDGTVRARETASAAAEQVRREEVDVARRELVAAIQQAFVLVEVARTTLPGLQRSVEAAIANYSQAEARFGSGLGTSVELADAAELRARAEIDFAVGRFDFAKARASFGRAIAEGL